MSVSITKPAEYANTKMAGLTLGALGVVFGDIGTSPLYTLRECFMPEHGLALTPGNVLGILSLIFWALIFVVTVKYILFVMRADNKGEGGILALMALAIHGRQTSPRKLTLLLALGIFGAALFYGDGMITPAISVLSAVEGLEVASPALEHVVVPVTLAILVALFSIQNRGTAKVGALFGPIMLVWFATLAVLGIKELVTDPSVLAAIDPRYGFAFLTAHGWV
ncbi:MAG TPA: KUP/HAK/KT family potassium transporter, partial [Azospirillaceae bacterium]|nr:KUP/HAK/KT family potassium transporter [Azospirillaceae bacterium]